MQVLVNVCFPLKSDPRTLIRPQDWIANLGHCRSQHYSRPGGWLHPEQSEETARKDKKDKRAREKSREDQKKREKTCLSSALRGWNPLSQLSGRWTSREPQWSVDSPGFGAQRVGSGPPSNPPNAPAPDHTHPSSHHPMHMAFHSLRMPLAHPNNRKHKQIYMCARVRVCSRALGRQIRGIWANCHFAAKQECHSGRNCNCGPGANKRLFVFPPRRHEDSGRPRPWILILIPHTRFTPISTYCCWQLQCCLNRTRILTFTLPVFSVSVLSVNLPRNEEKAHASLFISFFACSSF